MPSSHGRPTSNDYLSEEFSSGDNEFSEFTFTQINYMDGENIRFPCYKCRNRIILVCDNVTLHLYKKCFHDRLH